MSEVRGGRGARGQRADCTVLCWRRASTMRIVRLWRYACVLCVAAACVGCACDLRARLISPPPPSPSSPSSLPLLPHPPPPPSSQPN
ncbi:hypothetical protein B0H12DRAFT_1111317 [Mycena haematopus]|nr:hypothetical protein B0H12DRAFT_1111317 [Mycena haematopus]